MRKVTLGALALAALATALMAATASARVETTVATTQVAVLLPDSKSSVRWETQDRRFLAAAFQKAGVSYSIVNAENDRQRQRAQAEQALTNGAKVILLVNLDSGSGAAIQALARARGARVIDYDRLTLKGQRVVLRVVQQRRRRPSPGPGPRQLPEGERHVLQEAGRGAAARLADGQQRDALQPGLPLGPQPPVPERHLHEGPGPGGARLGQPEGADDLRADARPDQQQDQRGRRGERWARQRRDLGAEGPQADDDPGHRAGRDGPGRPEHPLRRPVHDRLQGDQGGGERRRALWRSR